MYSVAQTSIPLLSNQVRTAQGKRVILKIVNEELKGKLFGFGQNTELCSFTQYGGRPLEQKFHPEEFISNSDLSAYQCCVKISAGENLISSCDLCPSKFVYCTLLMTLSFRETIH
jgi:hypothetical protein